MSAKVRKARMEVVAIGGPESGDGATAQPADEDQWTPSGALNPPLNLDQLAGLTKVGRIRRSCIAACAHNSVGLGFTLGVREGHEDEVSDAEAEVRQARENLNALARRDAMLKRPSFSRLMSTVIWDKYEVGNGYLEVSRNRITGRIAGLFHAPGKRMRRTKERDGWIMLRRGGSLEGATRFYDFGQKVRYAEDGTPTGKLARNGQRWDTNEIIPFQLYTSESRDYGLPPDAQLAIDYLGDKLAGETNASFFGSSGVPPTVIFVQGEAVEDGEEIRIEVPPAFVKQVGDALRGNPNDAQSRVAIIGVPTGFQAQVENLAQRSERDIGFIQYRGDNRRATLGAYRLSPVFVADIEDAGKYTAEVERAITKEQVFDPEQQEVQETLDGTIIAELAPHLSIEFEELAIKGDEANRESANDLADHGRITNGEYRAAHGFGPLPEAAKDAEPEPGSGLVPFGWNAELVPAGLVNRGAPGTPPTPSPTPGQIAKVDPEDMSLEEQLVADFDDVVAEAIKTVHEIDPQVAVRPIVVEKQGDRVVIAPYSRNGASS